MQFVTIKNGSYRNAPVVNTVFPLVKGYQEGAKGGFVTVDARNVIGFNGSPDFIRVKVGPNDYEFHGEYIEDSLNKFEPIEMTVSKIKPVESD
jgi:hypothetical protein